MVAISKYLTDLALDQLYSAQKTKSPSQEYKEAHMLPVAAFAGLLKAGFHWRRNRRRSRRRSRSRKRF